METGATLGFGIRAEVQGLLGEAFCRPIGC